MTYEMSKNYIVKETDEEIDNMKRGFVFSQCIGFLGYTAVEVLFFLSGFNQSIAFLQSTNGKPRFAQVISYTVRRILKVAVPYGFNLIVIMQTMLLYYSKIEKCGTELTSIIDI
jgi:peptidoglycan/LPS O-acetylase OafA/YrhL